MKRFIVSLALAISLMSTCAWADRAQYVPDLVVTEPGAVWTDSRQYASLDAALTAMNAMSGGGTLLITEDITLADDKSVDADVVLKFTPGSVITITAAKTLTINGTVDAGIYQIFDDNDGAGTVTFVTTPGLSTNSVAYPEWWGADHDGTDDWAAIQSAVDCGIRVIEFQSNSDTGTGNNKYAVSAPIVVASSLMVLRGSGDGVAYRPEIVSTNLTPSAETGIINSAYSFLTLKNLTLTYAAANTNANAWGISLSSASYSHLSNIRIVNAYHGLVINASSSVRAEFIDISGFTGSAIYSLSGSDNLFVSDFEFTGGNAINCGNTNAAGTADRHGAGSTDIIPITTAGNCPTGLYTAQDDFGATGAIRLYGQTASSMFTRGEIVKSNYALYLDGTSNAWNACPSGCHFTDVFFDSAFQGSRVLHANNLIFDSCWFSSNTGSFESNAAGIYIADGIEISFDNCDFWNTGGSGLVVATGSYITVSNSRFTSIGGSFYYDDNVCTGHPGITIGANVSSFSFTDNIFRTDSSYATGNMNYGVYVTAGTSSQYRIANNDFLGLRATFTSADTYTYSIASIFDGGTGYNKNISDNISGAAELSIASANALTIPASGEYFFISGTTNITSIAIVGGGYPAVGRKITLLFEDILTVTDGGNLGLAGDFVTSGADSITLVANTGNVWYEVSRSVN